MTDSFGFTTEPSRSADTEVTEEKRPGFISDAQRRDFAGYPAPPLYPLRRSFAVCD